MPITIKRQSQVINIEVDKGSTFRHIFYWKTGVKGGETPVDLGDCTGRLLVKNLLEDRTVGTTELLDLTTENGGMLLEGTAKAENGGTVPLGTAKGEIEIVVSDELSEAFTWTEGIFGCEIYFPNGDTRRLFRGSMFAFDEIVR